MYLHELKIVHGDLKGVRHYSTQSLYVLTALQANILVDHMGTARLADFGLMSMTDLSTILLSKTTAPTCGTILWMSPELLDPARFGSDGLPSRESDLYAVGMTIYEVSSFASFWRLFLYPSAGT